MRARACGLATLMSLACFPACAQVAPLPPNYMALAISTVTSAVSDPALKANIQLAPPRQAIPPQLGDWLVCVRTGDARPNYFIVFFADKQVKSMRRPIAIDRCESEAYAPPPPPPKVTVGKKPAPKKEPNRFPAGDPRNARPQQLPTN